LSVIQQLLAVFDYSNKYLKENADDFSCSINIPEEFFESDYFELEKSLLMCSEDVV
jgi:hypothetical protein